MIRKITLVSLIFLTLVTGVAWASSYAILSPRLILFRDNRTPRFEIRLPLGPPKGFRFWSHYGREQLSLATHHGQLTIFHGTPQSCGTGLRSTHLSFAGLAWSGCGYDLSKPYLMQSIQVPLWMLLGIFAAYPILTVTPWARRRRWHRAGLCIGCGYDLTGNISGVCPECRTTVGSENRFEEAYSEPRPPAL